MEIRHKAVTDLTPTEYRACSLANYGVEGYMLEELARCRRGRFPGTAILLWDGPDDKVTSLIGWALLTPCRTYGLLSVTRWVMMRSKYTVQFWVKRHHRKQGHGKTLMLEVKKYDKNPNVFPHDKASAEFFSSYKCQVLREDNQWLLSGKPRVA